MDDDEVKIINELLNELEEIPSDGESIISDESDSLAMFVNLKFTQEKLIT